MRLYATATSERASKGQGGNDFLRIEVQDESQEIVATFHVQPGEEKTIITLDYAPALVQVYDEVKK